MYNESVADADFIMSIYGINDYPEVTIAVNVYAMRTVIWDAQSRFVINSIDKTVEEITARGDRYNYFNYRNPEYDIFAKIPSGKHKINLNGNFPVTITLFNYRSEPEWWKE